MHRMTSFVLLCVLVLALSYGLLLLFCIKVVLGLYVIRFGFGDLEIWRFCDLEVQ